LDIPFLRDNPTEPFFNSFDDSNQFLNTNSKEDLRKKLKKIPKLFSLIENVDEFSDEDDEVSKSIPPISPLLSNNIFPQSKKPSHSGGLSPSLVVKEYNIPSSSLNSSFQSSEKISNVNSNFSTKIHVDWIMAFFFFFLLYIYQC
jgi:hypothetical protein